jgi:hypothetical protein
MLLSIPEVQQELSLNDDQKKKAEAMVEETRTQIRATMGNVDFSQLQSMSQEEREKRFADFRKIAEEADKKADAKIEKLLDARQLKRLNELRLQREGPAALSRPEVAKKLGLSEELQAKIQKMVEDARSQGRDGPSGGRNASEEERRAMYSQYQERRKQLESDIMALLNDDQVVDWTALTGKEFKFPPSQGFGRRDRGNRPPPPPGGEQ